MLMADVKETLYDHVDEALNQYQVLFLSNGYDVFITNRLKMFSMNFEECGALAALALLLHDVGKAHIDYQNSLKENKKASICHEFYSVALAWDVLSIGGDERDVVTAAILLHHEFMRLPDPHRITKDFVGEVKELKEILDELSTKYKLSPYLDLSKLSPLRREHVFKIVSRIREKLLRDRNFYACTTLILRPLVICDNVSAHIHRMGRLPRILKDVEDPKLVSSIRKYVKEALGIL